MLKSITILDKHEATICIDNLAMELCVE